MDETRLLVDSFNIYYDKGIKALSEGSYDNAKRNILSAAECLLKLSKSSSGALKTNRLKRADELVKLAEEIAEKQSSEQNQKNQDNSKIDTSKFISNNTPSKKIQNDDDSISKFIPAGKTGVKLDDIAGLDEAKKEIQQSVIDPQKYPEIYARYKRKPGGGILLYGLPGTGKTMFAQAIATELNAVFYEIKSSDINSKWFGDSEQNIRNLFLEARSHPVSVIFFDEFDSMGGSRNTNSSVMKRLVPELLAQIQGFRESDNLLLVIGATNRPWDLDSAFLRPGRFDTKIYVDLPDDEARRKIITIQLSGIPTDEQLDFNQMVDITNGFNGADVVKFCNKLKDYAIKKSIELQGHIIPISNDDVKRAKDISFTSVQMEDWIKIQEYREANHG